MRIGILGAGDMGRTHARVLTGMPEVEIAGVVSRSRERAERVAVEVGAPALSNPWVVLDDDSVDAIDVTYPSGLHREWTVAALERGETRSLRDADGTDSGRRGCHDPGRPSA